MAMTKKDVKNVKIIITSKLEIDSEDLFESINLSSSITDDEEFTKEDLLMYVRENYDWADELTWNAQIKYAE